MRKENRYVSRRNFINSTSYAGMAFLLAPLLSTTQKNQIDEVTKSIGIDTHNHMDMPFDKETFSAMTYDLAGEMKKSGLTAICMTFCVDRPKLNAEGEAFQRFETSLDEMDQMLKVNGIKRALNFSDVLAAHKKQTPIVIQSVEGGHFIEGRLERLKIAYDKGLRLLGLMHDNQTTPPIGDIYTEPAKFGGLNEYGLNIIKECNRLGILIDLAHCSNEAIDDAIAISTQPILISHTGLNTQLGKNERMANVMLPRLISREQAKKVADAGGVIGVWTHLSDSPVEYAQNVRALAEVIGTDHVCIGTDTQMAPPASTNGRGGMKTNNAWQNMQEGFYYSVINALLQKGFNDKEITAIGGGNFLRIFDKATKKQSR
jgi:membrane dipeptidase